VARVEQARDQRAADVPAGTGDQDVHRRRKLACLR
jgi:hypothetical protein